MISWIALAVVLWVVVSMTVSAVYNSMILRHAEKAASESWLRDDSTHKLLVEIKELLKNGDDEMRSEEERRNKTIAVDFDGTVVTHEYPNVGRSIGAEPVLSELVERNHRLILLTMRSGELLKEAVRWFEDRNIPLWAVNDNPLQQAWTDSNKVWANYYIDDAALGTPMIAGICGNRDYVDWEAVRELLEDRGLLVSDEERVPEMTEDD